MTKRILPLVAGAIVLALVSLLGASPAGAAEVPVYAGGYEGNGYQSTTADGGAMTAEAAIQATGGAFPEEHPDRYIFDNAARVAGMSDVARGTTYQVTVTLHGARADEASTGTAEARGFAQVQLYDCCFAGETSTIGAPVQAELSAQADGVTITTEVVAPRDTTLNVEVELHARAAAYTDTDDAASVDASSDAVTVDVREVDAPAPPSEQPPAPGRSCFLFLCL